MGVWFMVVVVICFYSEAFSNANNTKKLNVVPSPNVLFLVLDDCRADIFDDTNYTPNIVSLAKASVVFTKAYAQQAVCAPSRNSFLTSRRPDSLHLYDFYSYWRDSVGNFTTLPQYFKNRLNYETISIGKVFHPGLTSNFTDDYPYSWSREPYHPKSFEHENDNNCRNKNGDKKKNLICPVPVKFQPDGTLPDIESTNEAIKYLKDYEKRDRANKNPYLLAVGFHKPHIPLRFPQEFIDFHPLDGIKLTKNYHKPYGMPTIAWNPWTDVRRRDDIAQLNLTFPFGEMPVDTTRKIIQSYRASVSYVDHLIGKIIQEIDLNKTIVILIGDHGWSLGENGEWAKYGNFDTVLKVPFILHIPGLYNKTIYVNEPVELVDIFPTIIEYVHPKTLMPTCSNDSNRKEKWCTEGKSLSKLIKSTIKRETIVNDYSALSQYPRPSIFPQEDSDKPQLKFIKFMGYSMLNRNYRYTEWLHFNTTTFKPDLLRKPVAVELYNHDFDVNENINLAALNPLKNVVEELSQKLRIKFKF